jgi:undecaprenyl pyrophosphate phosphatase UppP
MELPEAERQLMWNRYHRQTRKEWQTWCGVCVLAAMTMTVSVVASDIESSLLRAACSGLFVVIGGFFLCQYIIGRTRRRIRRELDRPTGTPED